MRIYRSIIARIFAVPVILSMIAACGADKTPPENDEAATVPNGIFSDQGNTIPTVQNLLEQSMPEQMADGIIKVAIVRNLALGDHTRQFLEGCVSEGRAMGFTVDTFITGGDNDRCRALIARICEADYDGLILSHGDADFTYNALKPVVDKNMKVVTFDALPYINGDPNQAILPGVTSTAQDDVKLAELSIETILSQFADADSAAPQRPVRVIRIWSGPGISPLDRRQSIYDEFIRQRKIEETAWVQPRDFTFARSGVRESLTALLQELPPGSVDAIWAPYDEFAKGCIDALEEAGRTDIKLVSIDISNDDIKLMLEHSEVWTATVAVDPRLIGIVNMRLLAAKFAGETTPERYTFEVQAVETPVLNQRINMANIAAVVLDWGREQGIFDEYPWMTVLKTAVRTYMRLPAQASEEAL